MNEVMYSNYAEFKGKMDAAVKSTCQDFVAIGYFLKQARDTGILQESGYTTMRDFAKTEYNIGESDASRFISICERYSEDGNSPKLRENYESFQVTKLAEMLALPEYVAEEISPSTTREEIRELKDAVKEEEKTTPLEVIAEAHEVGEVDPLAELVKQYLHENPEQFKALVKMMWETVGAEAEDVYKIIAAAGYCTIMGRVPGQGRKMINIKSPSENPVMTDIRSGEKEEVTWDLLFEAFSYATYVDEKLPDDVEEQARIIWKEKYGEPLPEGTKEKPKAVTVTREAAPEKKPKPQKAPEDSKPVEKPVSEATEPAQNIEEEPGQQAEDEEPDGMGFNYADSKDDGTLGATGQIFSESAWQPEKSEQGTEEPAAQGQQAILTTDEGRGLSEEAAQGYRIAIDKAINGMIVAEKTGNYYVVGQNAEKIKMLCDLLTQQGGR